MRFWVDFRAGLDCLKKWHFLPRTGWPNSDYKFIMSAVVISTLKLWVETSVAQWLRCGATNRKVSGSITGGVIGIFHWHNTSDRTMALGSTQPLTEMSTRKGGRYVRLTTLPPPCAVVMKSGNLNFLEPSGPLQACNGTALPFFFKLWVLDNLGKIL